MKRKARCLPGCSQSNTEAILRCRFPLILQHLTKTSMTKPYLHTSSLLHKHHLHTNKQADNFCPPGLLCRSVCSDTYLPKSSIRTQVEDTVSKTALLPSEPRHTLWVVSPVLMIAKLWISAPMTSEFH